MKLISPSITLLAVFGSYTLAAPMPASSESGSVSVSPDGYTNHVTAGSVNEEQYTTSSGEVKTVKVHALLRDV